MLGALLQRQQWENPPELEWVTFPNICFDRSTFRRTVPLMFQVRRSVFCNLELEVEMDRQRKFHYTIHNRYTHTRDPRHIRQTDNPCPHIYTNADARCIHTTRARPLACRLNTVTYALVRLLLHQKRGASRCDERKEILFPSRDVMRAGRYVPGVLFFLPSLVFVHSFLERQIDGPNSSPCGCMCMASGG